MIFKFVIFFTMALFSFSTHALGGGRVLNGGEDSSIIEELCSVVDPYDSDASRYEVCDKLSITTAREYLRCEALIDSFGLDVLCGMDMFPADYK